jgi:hypothetical protein
MKLLFQEEALIGLPLPKNQVMEVLYYLIHHHGATTRDIQRDCYVLNVTAKISEVRKLGVQVLCDERKAKNKFGREITFGSFKILNLAESKKIYIQKNK